MTWVLVMIYISSWSSEVKREDIRIYETQQKCESDRKDYTEVGSSMYRIYKCEERNE